MIYATNAISGNMFDTDGAAYRRRVTAGEAAAILATGFTSAVGHADIAAVMSGELGIQIEQNRITVLLQPGDQLVVGQYTGPRMAEGTHTLPEGATITWWHWTVE